MGDGADVAEALTPAPDCGSAPDSIHCLTEKAQERLQRALSDVERDLRERGLLEASEGQVYRVRTLEGCFDGGKPRERDALWSQMLGAVEFVSEFHRDRRGRANRWFSDILVCRAKELDDQSLIRGGFWGGELRLEGSTLQVGVRQRFFNRFEVQNGLRIRDRWDKGEHLAKTPLDDKKGIFRTKVWPALNPVGIVRVQGVAALRGAAKELAARLESLRALPDLAAKKAALLKTVGVETATQVDLNGQTLGQRAQRAVEALDAAQTNGVIDAWRKYMTGPSAADDAMEAMGAIHQGSSGRACNVDVKQFCLVAVNNAHCIHVELTAGSRLVGRFLQPETKESPHEVKVTQSSLVCVQTNDFVEVNVRLGPEKALASAGLASALGLPTD